MHFSHAISVKKKNRDKNSDFARDEGSRTKFGERFEF